MMCGMVLCSINASLEDVRHREGEDRISRIMSKIEKHLKLICSRLNIFQTCITEDAKKLFRRLFHEISPQQNATVLHNMFRHRKKYLAYCLIETLKQHKVPRPEEEVCFYSETTPQAIALIARKTNIPSIYSPPVDYVGRIRQMLQLPFCLEKYIIAACKRQGQRHGMRKPEVVTCACICLVIEELNRMASPLPPLIVNINELQKMFYVSKSSIQNLMLVMKQTGEVHAIRNQLDRDHDFLLSRMKRRVKC